MTLAVYDRVKETTTIVGTGTATLLGAQTGYQSFAVVGTGNTTPYYIADQSGVNWEVGIGTYTASGTTLARTTVLSSSNAGALVVFPAGTKDVGLTYPAETSVSGGGGGTYPTIQPTLNLDFANTKLLDPRITFVRNSTAAYYDGQTTAMAEQNLFTYSQDFSQTAWTQVRITLPSTTYTAPDGTSTAATIQTTSVNGLHVFFQALPSTLNGIVTLSFYLQAGTNNYAQIYNNGDAAAFANFDLTAGVVGTVGTKTTATITAVGTWYRCIVTFNAITTYLTSYGVNIIPTANSVYGFSWNPTGTETINLWGGQLEQRSAVTAYTKTTTAAITNYIPVLMTAPAGVARFDCDPLTGKSLGLLIEESRTNLLLYSATFSNATWTLTNATLTAVATIAPDGTQTAFNLVSNTSTGLQAIAQTVTKAASALAYTSTVHFKANQYTYSWLQISDGAGNGAIVYFNLTTGAISTAVAGIGTAFTALSATTPTSIGNGWYRCNITGTSNTATSLVTQFGSSTNGTSNSVVGDGYSGVFIWGAQAE